MTAIAFEGTSSFSLDDFVDVHTAANDTLWSSIQEHIDMDNHNHHHEIKDEHEMEDRAQMTRCKRRRLCTDDATSSVSTATPQQQFVQTPGIVIAFSGFKESQTQPNNFVFRDKLLRMAERLGACIVNSDADDLLSFDQRITHVVAPEEARTPRVIVAGITGRWILSPNWILDSMKKGSFVDESNYGARRTFGSPFINECVYLSQRFIDEDSKSTSSQRRHSRRDYLKAFVETFGGGKIVQDGSQAKYWVVSNEEKDQEAEDSDEDEFTDRVIMKWNEFVHFMYPASKIKQQQQTVTSQATTSSKVKVEDQGDDDDEEEYEEEEEAADEEEDDDDDDDEPVSPKERADPKESRHHHDARRKSGRRRSPSGSNRKESIEWNIEAEPAPCPFACGRSYTSTIGMKSHLKRFHTDEQKHQSWEMPRLKFQCRYCQYHSDRRSNLERHLNRFHVNDYYAAPSTNDRVSSDDLEGSDS